MRREGKRRTTFRATNKTDPSGYISEIQTGWTGETGSKKI
jgi:hypothetical protein